MIAQYARPVDKTKSSKHKEFVPYKSRGTSLLFLLDGEEFIIKPHYDVTNQVIYDLGPIVKNRQERKSDTRRFGFFTLNDDEIAQIKKIRT